MEYENTVDDVQEGVVDLPEDDEWMEPAASEAGELEAATPGQGIGRPAQTPEENAAFAAMRRENERLMHEMQERDSVFESFFPGAADPFLFAQAQASGMTAEELMEQRAAWEEQSMREKELSELRAFRAESTFGGDLNAIRAAYPDVQAGRVEELGVEFIKIMANSGLDAVTAYEIVRAKEEKARKAAPPEIGRVNSGSKADRGLFTRDEVKGMTQDEVSRNWNKIEKSRARWK